VLELAGEQWRANERAKQHRQREHQAGNRLRAAALDHPAAAAPVVPGEGLRQ
jgi:hypothetical protein